MNKIPIYEYETKHGTKYGFRFYGGQDTNKDYSKTIQKRGFKDFDSALSAYMDTKKAFENGQSKPRPKRYTYKDIYKLWLKQHKQDIKLSTACTIENLFNKHILPSFGNRYITKITPLVCQAAVNQWSKDCKGTYKSIANRANAVFDYAYRLELIKDNPMKKVMIPRNKKNDKRENYYSKQELNEFLEYCKSDLTYKYFAVFRVLAYSGMRKGELRGLLWSDIDFEKNTISINKTVSYNEKWQPIVQSTKTKKSTRIITMDVKTMLILRKWQVMQQKKLLMLGYNSLSSKQLVFQGNGNKFLSRDMINKMLILVQEKHGLKKITVHGLRHTHCSLLLAAGVPVNDVKDRLGHANIQTTLDIYAHVSDQQRKDTADKFSQYMQA